MTDNRLAEPLKFIFQQVFQISNVSLSDSPATISEWDSIGHLSLIETLKQEFQIDFSVREINQMESVSAIQQLLQQKGVQIC